jgi:putative restriction endonuclease
MLGTIAITDYGWYQRLSSYPALDEVNFWKPSSKQTFNAPGFSPFLFKLKSPHNAICGFGYFARYSRLPDWLAWDAFNVGNGCDSLREMRERIGAIRERIRYKGQTGDSSIGCIIVVQPQFFPQERWIPQPSDWPARLQSAMRYDLAFGEGLRVWQECLAVAADLGQPAAAELAKVMEHGQRYGAPVLTMPRLGQGAFKIAVTDIYGRCCAVTEEHSLPALEAAHIRPYAEDGPHSPDNGLLLRADFHRLLDQGYLTIDDGRRLVVSGRLRDDYANGKSYYPFQGRKIHVPSAPADQPALGFLRWHQENRFRG